MIHINVGSNLDSKFGTKFNNISVAIELLIDAKFKINKISNYIFEDNFIKKTSLKVHLRLMEGTTLMPFEITFIKNNL